MPPAVLSGTDRFSFLPRSFPFVEVLARAANGPGVFTVLLDGSGGGVMPLTGTTFICLFDVCGGTRPPIEFPLALSVVGQGGTAVSGPTGLEATVVGAPFTLGTASMMLSFF